MQRRVCVHLYPNNIFKTDCKGQETGQVSPRQWFSGREVVAVEWRSGLSSARCHFHPYINRSRSSVHLFAALSHSLPVFLRLTPVNQPSGIIAYITMSWTCDGLKPQRKERWDDCERVNMGRWEQGRESKIARVRLPGHFSRRPGTPQLIRFGWSVSGGGPHGYLSTSLPTYLPTYRHMQGPDNRYNRTWRMPTIATTPSSLSEIRTFKTVSSTLADSLDRYFNPFLAPPDPATPHQSPVSGTTSPITLWFNSLYHYLRAQKVNATLITMFNSSTPLSISSLPPQFLTLCEHFYLKHIPRVMEFVHRQIVLNTVSMRNASWYKNIAPLSNITTRKWLPRK